MAVRLLAETGLEITHPLLVERLTQAGLPWSGKRVLFPAEVVAEHLAQMRREIAPPPNPNPPADDGLLWLHTSSYPLYVHDLASDQVVPFTSERLVEAIKLVDTLADQRVTGVPPGIPTDQPPELQPICQYYLAAMYARQGASPTDPTSARTVHHLLDMAEVMGRPVRSLPVYTTTPLRLGGESLEVVLACHRRLEHISIGNMPSTGATAPIHPFGALALGAAELIGGMICLRLVTGLPVSFYVNIFPFDLRTGAMVFGSPENLLFQMLAGDLNRFYGHAANPAPDNIHVMAKQPDSQAAAEKAAIMALGAFLGARHFSCAGALSLDEIFSPVQLLVDCEMRDWLERAIRGVWFGEEAVDDWLAEIQAGLERSFMALDSTLDHYRAHTWFPARFERGAIGRWLERGQPALVDQLKEEVRRRLARYDYELDPARRAEIERIYRSARQAELGR
jgi:trimethylamine:corrinoid methyltransferase-like protein